MKERIPTAILEEKVWIPEFEELSTERDFVKSEIRRIGTKVLRKLSHEALIARESAYNPYSGYSVGSAILTNQGEVYSACNAENVVYNADHAEGAAISRAIREGAAKKERKFIQAIACCSAGEGSGPCGQCRQRILEHADNALYLSVSPIGEIRKITSMKILMPYAFTPSHLGLI